MEILSWFLVEALSATALLLLMVWWTWPRKPKDAEPNKAANEESANEASKAVRREQEPPK